MKFDDIIDGYLNTRFFVESPMYYNGAFNDRMQDVEHNRNITKTIVSKHVPFDCFKTWVIYKIQDGFDEERHTFCLVDNELVDAFVEITSNKINNYSNGVWQRRMASKGLVRDFVLNFLPKYYQSVISDKTANKLGISFYRKLLDGAIKKGYRVTVLNGSHKNEESYDPDKFDDYWIDVDSDVPVHPTFMTSRDVLFKIHFK